MKEALTILGLCALTACAADNKSEAPAAAPSVEASAAATAEASAAPAPPPPPKSLFDRVNGGNGITKFVDDAIANVKADKRVSKYLPRDQKKLAAFHDDLIAQIGAGAGGPASTRDTKATVTAMKIKAKDFDFIVEDVAKAAASDFSDAEAKEFMDAFTGMKGDLTAKK